jgi:hypothetical protein
MGMDGIARRGQRSGGPQRWDQSASVPGPSPKNPDSKRVSTSMAAACPSRLSLLNAVPDRAGDREGRRRVTRARTGDDARRTIVETEVAR